MKTWLRYTIYLWFAAIIPEESIAQDIDVGVAASVSYQFSL